MQRLTFAYDDVRWLLKELGTFSGQPEDPDPTRKWTSLGLVADDGSGGRPPGIYLARQGFPPTPVARALEARTPREMRRLFVRVFQGKPTVIPVIVEGLVERFGRLAPGEPVSFAVQPIPACLADRVRCGLRAIFGAGKPTQTPRGETVMRLV